MMPLSENWMWIFFTAVLPLLFGCFYARTAVAVVKLIDTSEHPVVLEKPAERIISLSPGLTEMLFAIGAGKKIAGVSADSNYPVAAKKIPVIASASQLDLAAILALRPDLIVAWKGGNPADQLQRLQSWHIPVYFYRPGNIADISLAMIQLGLLTGTTTQANNVAGRFRQKISKLKQRYHGKKRLRVFYEIWLHPLFTIGSTSLISKAMTLCGGTNVFSRTFGAAPQIELESVFAANPQVIIGGFNRNRWKRHWLRWQSIAAVKAGQLYSINPDLLQRFGPRFAEGTAQLCHALNLARQHLT